MRGPGIILAFNHENRGDDGLPTEGYVRSFLAKAIGGWRCKQFKVRRHPPARVRNTDRTADSLPISVFVFDQAPDGDDGQPFECVGVRPVKGLGRSAEVFRAVYLLVLDVDVVDLENRLGTDDDVNLHVLLSFCQIKAAGRTAGSWMQENVKAALPRCNHGTLRSFRSVANTIQRIFGATSRREIRDWNHVSGSRAG